MIQSNNSGFTLFETILVIVILSMLTAFIPLQSSDYLKIGLNSTAKSIVYDLRWARMQAILHNRDYHFRIYKDDDIYRRDLDGKSDYIIYTVEGKKNNVVRIGSYPAKYILYKNLTPVKIEDDYYDRIKFTGYGTASTGTIGLKLNNERLVQVVISQFGRVRIEK